MNASPQRMVVISNRLPISITREEQKLEAKKGSGGLVTALAPLIKRHQGLWIGWLGIPELNDSENQTLMAQGRLELGFPISSLTLTKKEVNLYYNGFSNEIIWPLFHDMQSHCDFNPDYWYGYQQVNQKFAEHTLSQTRENDFIWIHDYQLMLMGQEMRKKGFQGKLSFFLHIPFPPLDIFLKLPWRFQILRALLDFDCIGFQTTRDKRNFVQCVRALLPRISHQSHKGIHLYHLNEREVRVGAFPISIDYNQFSEKAQSKEVQDQAWYLHEKFPGQKIVFSLDRLDYTKGFPYRLKAIRHLLKTHPELHQKVSFIQIVVPSRTNLPQYQSLKQEIDRLVGEINSEFTRNSWVPIQYMYRSIAQEELLTYYRASEIALITSIKDGMNLVCKEYLASNIDETGTLILSEFAGAAAQLQHDALLINPYDVEGVANAIQQAINLSPESRKKRMHKMRRHLSRNDVYHWIQSYLQIAISKDLRDFPASDEEAPQEHDMARLSYSAIE